MLPTIHIIYENDSWNPPILEALEEAGLPYRLHFLDDGLVDPHEVPADGIWWNRVSPSSHTRDHAHTVGLTRELLFWLEHHGRIVINGSRAFEIEMSKLRQDMLLRKHGLPTPRTVLTAGSDALKSAAARFEGAFITKHNQGGKGLGIQLFSSAAQLVDWVDAGNFDPGPEGKVILQEYIQAPEPFITRVEIAGGRFLFAMRSRTDDGFQLCPSDACQVPASNPDVCPADGSPAAASKFSASPLTADDPLVRKLIALMDAEGIDMAGTEFIEDAAGNRYVYDINGTTNYSGVLAEQTGIYGMREVAAWILRDLVPRWRGLRAA